VSKRIGVGEPLKASLGTGVGGAVKVSYVESNSSDNAVLHFNPTTIRMIEAWRTVVPKLILPPSRRPTARIRIRIRIPWRPAIKPNFTGTFSVLDPISLPPSLPPSSKGYVRVRALDRELTSSVGRGKEREDGHFSCR